MISAPCPSRRSSNAMRGSTRRRSRTSPTAVRTRPARTIATWRACAALLAGLPDSVPAATINRLCGSGMNAIGAIVDAIHGFRLDIGIAGGVESMSRAPFVLPKQAEAFGRDASLFDTTLGWRFVNPELEAQYGVDSMAETAENVAREYSIPRQDQDAFALRSQERAAARGESRPFRRRDRPGVCAAEARRSARGRHRRTPARRTRRSRRSPSSRPSRARTGR